MSSRPLPDARTSAPPRIGWLAFAGTCAIWGSTFLVIRIGNDSLPPLWAAGVRLLLAWGLLELLVRAARVPRPRGRARSTALQFGLVNFGFGFALLYWGERAVPSGMTAVTFGIIPLTSALLASAFGLERLRPLKVVGALVAFAGVATIFSTQIHAAVPLPRLLAVFASALCSSLSGILLKRGPRQHPLGVNAAGAPVGAAVCMLASFVAREPHPLPHTFPAVWPLLYLTLAGSGGAFVLFTWLIQNWQVSRVSYVSVVTPVIATALGVLLLHEPLPAAALLGTALVLAGLGLGITAGAAD